MAECLAHSDSVSASTEAGYAPNVGRREVPGSIPGRACRPSRSEFSLVFSEIRINTD